MFAKKITAILIAIVILLSYAAPTFADSGDIIPPPDDELIDSLDSEKYSEFSYTFDSEDLKITDVVPAAFKGLADVVFSINVLMSRVVNLLLVQAFQLDIFDLIENVFDELVDALSGIIYDSMLDILLPIAGIAMIFFVIVLKPMRAISLMFQTIVILVIAAIFFTAPSAVISTVNDISQELGTGSLAATASVVNGNSVGANDAVVSLSNIYWGNAVGNPWQLIQFGELEPEKAQEYLQADASDRENMAKDEDGMLFGKPGQAMRFVLAVLFFAMNLIQSALLLLLSGIMLLSQLGAIIASLTAIIGITIALLPNMGLRVAIHAVYNVFTFLFTRLGIMLLMCIYFAIAAVLYRNIGTMGWFMTMLCQILLIGATVIYRAKLFSFIHSATRGAAAATGAINQKVNLKRAALEGYAAYKIGSDVKRVWDNRQNRNLEHKYEPTAEKYMYKRYSDEKAQAEKVAEESGKPVQYSDFVRKVDARVERGFTPFSTDDMNSAKKMMVNIHRQGEDPDRYVMTNVSGKTDDQIRHTQRELEGKLNQTKGELKTKEDANENTINRVIRTDKQSEFYNRRRAIVEGVKGYVGKGQKDPYYNVLDGSAEANAAQEAQSSRQTADGTTPTAVPEEIKAKVETSSASGSGKEQPILREAATSNENVASRIAVPEDAKAKMESSSVPGTGNEQTIIRETTTTNEGVTSKAEVVKNVSEVNNVQRTEERKETEQKNVSTTSNETVKTHHENVENRTETVNTTKQNDVQSITNEKKDFINVETNTETQTTNVNQRISNVQNNVTEKNEVVNEKVVNIANMKEVESTTRNQERTNRIESEPSSNRREVFNKLDRLDKKNNNNQ